MGCEPSALVSGFWAPIVHLVVQLEPLRPAPGPVLAAHSSFSRLDCLLSSLLAATLLGRPHAQNHSNEDIYDKAISLLENFFDVEDGEVENLAPAVAEGGTFAFGAPPMQPGGSFGQQPPTGGFNFMQQ